MLCHQQPVESKSKSPAESNQAFVEALYLRYEQLIMIFLQKVASDKAALQDLTQIVLENLYRKAHKLKTYDEDHLIAYVIVTVKHVAYNYNKKRYKENAIFAVDQADMPHVTYPETESVVEAEVFRNEVVRYCRRELSKLSEHDQWLLYSKYILDMSNEELAQKEQCKPASIRMKLTRARRAARKVFDKKDMEGLL